MTWLKTVGDVVIVVGLACAAFTGNLTVTLALGFLIVANSIDERRRP